MRETTVLVEGESDRVAVETLARRVGHDLTTGRVTVVPMGGATSIAHFLDRYGPSGAGHRLLGLCDEGESGGVARALARAGLGSGSLEELGFHVCHADLEDELIRCLGTDAVLDVIAAEGKLASFGILQRQPAQRERPLTTQLRRFFAGRSGHKVRYARLLVDALPTGSAPPPLARSLRRSEAIDGRHHPSCPNAARDDRLRRVGWRVGPVAAGGRLPTWTSRRAPG